MQAMEVAECFHVQHVYATPSDYRISKGGVINGLTGNKTFKKTCFIHNVTETYYMTRNPEVYGGCGNCRNHVTMEIFTTRSAMSAS